MKKIKNLKLFSSFFLASVSFDTFLLIFAYLLSLSSHIIISSEYENATSSLKSSRRNERVILRERDVLLMLPVLNVEHCDSFLPFFFSVHSWCGSFGVSLTHSFALVYARRQFRRCQFHLVLTLPTLANSAAIAIFFCLNFFFSLFNLFFCLCVFYPPTRCMPFVDCCSSKHLFCIFLFTLSTFFAPIKKLFYEPRQKRGLASLRFCVLSR